MNYLFKDTKFLPDENFLENYQLLENNLNAQKFNGYFPSFDGLKLYYEYFLRDKPKANVVIVHGLSEFSAKFYEIINFLLNGNLNVFIFDLRGHGYSGREVQDLQRIFLRSYDDYVKDLEIFIDQIVNKNSDLPLYFFSQSMGGAITALYLQKHPDSAIKCLFSVPMLCPNMKNVPRVLVQIVAKKDCKKHGFDAPFRYSSRFNPDDKFVDSSCLSELRFKLYLQKRIDNKFYQTSQITNGWMLETTKLLPKLLNKKKNSKIKTQCLIISAENDNVVLIKPQKKYAKQLNNCKFINLLGATHTVYASAETVMIDFYNYLQDFFIS